MLSLFVSRAQAGGTPLLHKLHLDSLLKVTLPSLFNPLPITPSTLSPSSFTTPPVLTDVGEDDCFTGQGSQPSAPSYGWVGDLRLDLPVDEDDYLMPSPQPSGLATVGPSHQHYMDLMADAPGETNLSSQTRRKERLSCSLVVFAPVVNDLGCCTHKINANFSTDGRRGEPGRGGPKGPNNNGMVGQQWVGMDNPEYHMMNARAQMYAGRRLHPQQMVGVPVLDGAGRFGPYGNGLPQQGQHLGSGQRLPSPTQEMPHEYYNELSSHPPHNNLNSRSETTV